MNHTTNTEEAYTLPVQLYKRVLKLMGNRFEISVVAGSNEEGNFIIDEAVKEISRIERLFTTFNEESQTSLINRNAGISPVPVDEEMFELIKRSIRVSSLTQGAFDITYGSIDKSLWNFDTSMSSLPDPDEAKKLVKLINYKNIILDAKYGTVFLKEKGMRIGFGGIGKGYAADQARSVMKRLGATSGIVNASGDLCAWGHTPDGAPWTIGIADPNLKHHIISYLELTDMAVATSGNYEKYAVIDSKKYSHTIDPKTGYPVSGIKSVTIVCPSAELADALATPVMVMGVKVGMDMINQMKNIACIIIDDENNAYTSNNIKIS